MRKLSHSGSASRPTVGRWLWACREGFEAILCEEFERAGVKARILEPGLVESARRTEKHPTFARLGFPVEWAGSAGAEAVARIAHHWEGPVWLQAWVPDSTEGNRRSRQALKLGGEVLAERRRAQLPVHESSKTAALARIPLGQVVLLTDGIVIGTQSPEEGDPDVAGGRTRSRRWKTSPSRAAMKLDEALRWKGRAPARGERCVDLGAAPGGWSERLLALGAQVIAVDPAKLRADLMANRALEHVVASAFDYAPSGRVDWLLCDMAWRPLEVAQLLAKWARQRWARELVANIKLPMRDKLPMVERVCATLEAGGWGQLRARQLYHDRDEITVVATTP